MISDGHSRVYIADKKNVFFRNAIRLFPGKIDFCKE